MTERTEQYANTTAKDRYKKAHHEDHKQVAPKIKEAAAAADAAQDQLVASYTHLRAVAKDKAALVGTASAVLAGTGTVLRIAGKLLFRRR